VALTTFAAERRPAGALCSNRSTSPARWMLSRKPAAAAAAAAYK